jgi:hypothetical protein
VYVIDYYAIITFVMIPRDDPGKTECPCLRAGCHSSDTLPHIEDGRGGGA